MRCIFSYIHENKVTVSLSKCRQCYLILLKGIRKELQFSFICIGEYVLIKIISFKITRCKLTEVTGPLVPPEI